MIRSLPCVLLRAIVRELNSHGTNLHEIARGAAISVQELQRLMEFGALPDHETTDRLIALNNGSIDAKAAQICSNSRAFPASSEQLAPRVDIRAHALKCPQWGRYRTGRFEARILWRRTYRALSTSVTGNAKSKPTAQVDHHTPPTTSNVHGANLTVRPAIHFASANSCRTRIRVRNGAGD